MVQFELTHYGQTRILANASPHGSAAVSKPAKVAASASGGVKTSGKLRGDGPDVGVPVDADGVGSLSVGAAAAAAATAVPAAFDDKPSGDYPGAEGDAQIDVPVVQLDTPDGSGAPKPIDAEVSASMPGATLPRPHLPPTTVLKRPPPQAPAAAADATDALPQSSLLSHS